MVADAAAVLALDARGVPDVIDMSVGQEKDFNFRDRAPPATSAASCGASIRRPCSGRKKQFVSKIPPVKVSICMPGRERLENADCLSQCRVQLLVCCDINFGITFHDCAFHFFCQFASLLSEAVLMR